jgi:hypothetical protein
MAWHAIPCVYHIYRLLLIFLSISIFLLIEKVSRLSTQYNRRSNRAHDIKRLSSTSNYNR